MEIPGKGSTTGLSILSSGPGIREYQKLVISRRPFSRIDCKRNDLFTKPLDGPEQKI